MMTLFDMGKEDVESERDALEQVREMGYNMFGDIRTCDMAPFCMSWVQMTPVGKWVTWVGKHLTLEVLCVSLLKPWLGLG